jgi:hypothetical protein
MVKKYHFLFILLFTLIFAFIIRNIIFLSKKELCHNGKCITIVSKEQIEIGGYAIEKKVYIGTKWLMYPFFAAIDFYPDTNIVITTEDDKFRIVSNQPPKKVRNLERQKVFNLISDNLEFEQLDTKFPFFSY